MKLVYIFQHVIAIINYLLYCSTLNIYIFRHHRGRILICISRDWWYIVCICFLAVTQHDMYKRSKVLTCGLWNPVKKITRKIFTNNIKIWRLRRKYNKLPQEMDLKLFIFIFNAVTRTRIRKYSEILRLIYFVSINHCKLLEF